MKQMNVLLVGEDGKKIGMVTLEEANSAARNAGKDLIIVDAENGVYRIADAGRLKYERQQQRKKQSAQRRTHKVKEVQVRPMIEDHDLEVKSKRIKDFLKKGLKTKVVMRFKGRQIANTAAAEEKLKAIVEEAVQECSATVDRPPKFEGKNLVVFLIPPKD